MYTASFQPLIAELQYTFHYTLSHLICTEGSQRKSRPNICCCPENVYIAAALGNINRSKQHSHCLTVNVIHAIGVGHLHRTYMCV